MFNVLWLLNNSFIYFAIPSRLPYCSLCQPIGRPRTLAVPRALSCSQALRDPSCCICRAAAQCRAALTSATGRPLYLSHRAFGSHLLYSSNCTQLSVRSAPKFWTAHRMLLYLRARAAACLAACAVGSTVGGTCARCFRRSLMCVHAGLGFGGGIVAASTRSAHFTPPFTDIRPSSSLRRRACSSVARGAEQELPVECRC